jgi:hypothetical protein
MREHEVEGAALLLAPDGSRAGSDREDEQDERREHCEDLAVEIPGGTRDVELAAREEPAQSLR